MATGRLENGLTKFVLWGGVLFSSWLILLSVLASGSAQARFDDPGKLKGTVAVLYDRGPYERSANLFGMRHPGVTYTDSFGIKREYWGPSAAFPGYFKIGEEVSLLRGYTGRMMIDDAWYHWQGSLVTVMVFGTTLIVCVRLLRKKPERTVQATSTSTDC